jgi:hypothetical protein
MTFHQLVDDAGQTYSTYCVEFIAADPYLEPGWYWTTYYPRGHGDMIGPFKSQGDAMRDASLVQ